ncbi:general odorant-binding protein 83a-like isoform X1 [Anthonomus grandis grandis]|uniref:general odorant-binding protein 83a-like isoform X1 n=1 Tax=Anthonomus grandis grandis TaxID=2921223 RepID=UPI00216594B4|nr:general odorant-binding protein 83a-like isoform X1 [Anthonomus grandis grandis]
MVFTKFCTVLVISCVLCLSFVDAMRMQITLPAELQEYIDDLHKLCLDRGGLQETDHETYDINTKDQKMMCYMKCLMLESKWMKPEGIIDYDFIDSQAHPDIKDILMAAVNKCRNIDEGADLCEKSYNFNKCLHRADPVNWFLV